MRQYSVNENLPFVPTSMSPKLSKERQRVRQLLAQQEIIYPKLFNSLRSALYSFIGFEIGECEEKLSRNSDDSETETDEEPVVKIE